MKYFNTDEQGNITGFYTAEINEIKPEYKQISNELWQQLLQGDYVLDTSMPFDGTINSFKPKPIPQPEPQPQPPSMEERLSAVEAAISALMGV